MSMELIFFKLIIYRYNHTPKTEYHQTDEPVKRDYCID